MALTIKELEDLIKVAPDKTLPVHIWCNDAQLRASVKEARLESKELILHEEDDEITNSELGIVDEDYEDPSGENEDEEEDED